MKLRKKSITEPTPFSLRIDMSPNLRTSTIVLDQDAELVKGPNPQMIQMTTTPFMESTVFLAGKDYRFTPLSESDTLVFDNWIKKCDGVEEPYYITYEAGFLFPDRVFGKHDYQLVDLATLAGTVVSEPMKGNEYYDAFKPLIGQFYYYDELKITVDGGYDQPLRNECN